MKKKHKKKKQRTGQPLFDAAPTAVTDIDPRSFRSLLKEERQEGNVLSVKLVELANKYGMTPQGVSSHATLLEEKGLDPEDISPHVVLHANSIMRRDWERVTERVSEYNSRFEEKVVGEFDQPASVTTIKRSKLFGHPVTAVIRWMGAEDWDYDDAQKALLALNIEMSESTIRAQLRAGKLAERGEPAELTDEQERQLYRAAK